MRKRRLIRGFLITFLLLCAGAWLWSMNHVAHVDHDDRAGYETSCGINWGVVYVYRRWEFSILYTNRWEFRHDAMPFHFVDPNSFPGPIPFLPGFTCYHWQIMGCSTGGTDQRGAQAPLWFFMLLSAGLLYLACRKRRPKIDPQTAFPVEIPPASR